VSLEVRMTHYLSGTLVRVPDVVVQLTVKVRPGPFSTLLERSAAQTLETFDVRIKTKIK